MGAKQLSSSHNVTEHPQIFAIQLMEHLVVPTFVLDASGTCIIWNLACERLTGLAAAQVVGTKDHWRGLYRRKRPCLADLVLRERSDSIDSLYSVNRGKSFGDTGLSAENWCEPPNACGQRRYLAFDAGPIFSETGELLAVVETLRDITVQKEAQMALEALASQDGLTGIPNRRYFDQFLQQEWHRAMRDDRPLSLLMIDIDHFKQYNDVLGHQNGDECLKRTASLLSGAMLRSTDFVARYGGEEFAAVLPGTDLDGAASVGERILEIMGATALPHPGIDPKVLTVSIGAASIGTDMTSPDSLIATADAALYNAKRQGRNRVVVAERARAPQAEALMSA
jgi:diguanylate cyclase (GGDEF)-like protein